ncbi:hypothetical protein GCM10009100_39840 [Thalassospira tepidiphila]
MVGLVTGADPESTSTGSDGMVSVAKNVNSGTWEPKRERIRNLFYLATYKSKSTPVRKVTYNLADDQSE